MIRLYSDAAIDALLAADRKAAAAQAAEQYASAIELLLPLPCKHRDGREPAGCCRCVERRTVQAAAAVVRETGGVR